MAPVVIRAVDVRKTYALSQPNAVTFRDAFVGWFRPGPPPATEFAALRGVSFEVPAGEAVGIIGRNGSGKSTLLKLLTGIIRPDGGKVSVEGRVSPLLELGAGFHPEFSGRENVRLNGILLGMHPDEVDAAFARIVEFAGIGDFIDQPVRTYSSGMYARLAFSVAVHATPDVLIIDEALSVGDRVFKARCIERIQAMKRAGATVLLVSHETDSLRTICDRLIWLDAGVVRMDGGVDAVLDAYQDALPAETAASATSLRAVAADGRPLTTVSGREPFFLEFDWLAPAGMATTWRVEVRRAADLALLGTACSDRPLIGQDRPATVRLRASAADLPAGRYVLQVSAACDTGPLPGAIAHLALTVADSDERTPTLLLPGGWSCAAEEVTI